MEPEPTVSKQVIPAISNDALILVGMFRAMQVGQILTYEEMTKAIGRDVTTSGRGVMNTAINRVLKDENIVVECVRLVGFKRLDGKELIDAQRAGVQRIRGEAKRRSEKLSKLDLGKLDQTGLVEAYALQSMYGVMSHVATGRGVKKLESAVQKADSKLLPIGKTLALFHDEA